MSAPPVFDAAAVWTLLAGDVTAIAELMAIIGSELPAHVHAVNAAAAREDWREVGRLAHQIRGMVGNVSADTVCGIASFIESDVREGRRDRMAGLLSALGRASEDLVDALSSWVPAEPNRTVSCAC